MRTTALLVAALLASLVTGSALGSATSLQHAVCPVSGSTGAMPPCKTPIRGTCTKHVGAYHAVSFVVRLRRVPAVQSQPYTGSAPISVLRVTGLVHGRQASYIAMKKTGPHSWVGTATYGTTAVRTWLDYTSGKQVYIYDRCR
jgi:hypothetical protein